MRRSIRPKLTFGLSDAVALFDKLLFDLWRLREPRNSLEPRYAAFDCASDSWHLAEWVIAAASEPDHLRLTGEPPSASKGKITLGFIHTNNKRLPYLSYCQQIANSGKHLRLYQKTDPELATKGSWRIRPPFEPVVQIITPKGDVPATEFFTTMAEDWKRFLLEEGYEFPPEVQE